MRILHINTYDRGGAAKACIRLHNSLLTNKSSSRLLFFQRYTEENITESAVYNLKKSIFEVYRFKLRGLFKKKNSTVKTEIKNLIPAKLEWFSFPDPELDITKHPWYQWADIIHLHWVSDFLNYDFFEKNKKPVVWTMHDMNPFTGGCHYTGGCTGFQHECLNCPQIQNTSNPDYTNKNLKYKQKFTHSPSSTNIVVTPSVWLGQQSKQSKITNNWKHLHIPYGLNSQIFQPRDKAESRRLLGLPLDKKIILFVAFYSLNIERKGFKVLLEALKLLPQQEDVVLTAVGGEYKSQENQLPIFNLGLVHDEYQMSLIYSASDVFVIPSIQDNLPNTVLESLLCGTPVIGFPIGGIPDMVQNGINGFLCCDVSPKNLAENITKFLEHATIFNTKKIRDQAVQKYDQQKQVNAYTTLYKHLLPQ